MFRIFRFFRKKDAPGAGSEQKRNHARFPGRKDDPYEFYNITDDRGLLYVRNGQTYEEALAVREKHRAKKRLK